MQNVCTGWEANPWPIGWQILLTTRPFQTDQQYLYVHQVLLNLFHKEGYLDKSVVPFLDGFTKDYKKIVITG